MWGFVVVLVRAVCLRCRAHFVFAPLLVPFFRLNKLRIGGIPVV